jgi:hypothetical protein
MIAAPKWNSGKPISVHPETASFGPSRHSRSFEIFDLAPLRLWFQICCGLSLNQNPLFLDGHQLEIFGAAQRCRRSEALYGVDEIGPREKCSRNGSNLLSARKSGQDDVLNFLSVKN